jgi:hypothetical protein
MLQMKYQGRAREASGTKTKFDDLNSNSSYNFDKY